MSEPRTAAGRALLERFGGLPDFSRQPMRPNDIAAIEREAVEACLASPEAVERLAQLLVDKHLFGALWDEAGRTPEDRVRPVAVEYLRILAAMREEQG